MGWKPVSEFDARIHPAINDRFLVAGTHPNGVHWTDACYWSAQGWFVGHRADKIEFWQFMPDHPANEGNAELPHGIRGH